MKIKCLLFVFLPVFLFGQNISYKKVTVDPYKIIQNYEHFKRFVLNSSDPFPEFIEGFDFEWGYCYTLKVKQEKIIPLSDGTRYNYYLSKIISKKKAPDSLAFIMHIDPLRYYHKIVAGDLYNKEDELDNYSLKKLNDSTYFYMDEIEIEIPSLLQKTLIAKLGKENGFRGMFTFVNKKRIRLKSFK